MLDQDPVDRDTILEDLRQEVEKAKILFEEAKREHDLALERMRLLGMSHPDGSIRQATVAYTYPGAIPAGSLAI